MDYIIKFSPSMESVLDTAEVVLYKLDPYIPIASCVTGVLLTADGIRRMVKNGISKGAVLETAMGVVVTALSAMRLKGLYDNHCARQAAMEVQRLRNRAVRIATEATRSRIEYAVHGLKNATNVDISCQLDKAYLPRPSGWPKIDCVVTLAEDNIVHSGFGATRYDMLREQCVPPTDEAIEELKHYFEMTPEDYVAHKAEMGKWTAANCISRSISIGESSGLSIFDGHGYWRDQFYGDTIFQIKK